MKPAPRHTADAGDGCRLTDVVDEPLDLALHAPVAELHLAQLVGAHDARVSGGGEAGGTRVVRVPRRAQRTAVGGRRVE